MNLILAYKSLVKKKFFMITTIIQLVVSGLLLYMIINQYSNVNVNSNRIDTLFKDNYYVFEQNSPINLQEIKLDNLIDIKNYIETNDIKIYGANETAIYIDYKGYLERGVVSNNIKEINKESFIQSKAYYVNENFIMDTGIELEQGEYKKTYEQYIPVILGYNYINKFKINDKIKYLYSDDNGNYYTKEMIVTGFLKKQSLLAEGGDPNSIKIVDDYILLPFNINQKTLEDTNFNMIGKINIFNLISYGYYDIRDSDELINLEKKFAGNGLNLKSVSLDDKIIKFKDDTNMNMVPLNLFLISIMMFTVLSIIVVVMNMINRNMYEYFVHMLLGATVTDIIKRIWHEIFIIFFISNILVAIIIKFLFKSDGILKFNIENFGVMSVIMLIIFNLILIAPIVKLKRHCLNSSLRSND